MRNIDRIRRRVAGRTSLFALFAAGLVSSTGAWKLYTEQLALQPASKLWVEGTSSIRSFSCQAGEVKATVEASGSNAVARLMTGEKAVESVNVVVPSEKLDCGNGTMNEHMRKAIKLPEFKSIEFRLTDYTVAHNTDGVTGTIDGTLLLGGVTKPISLQATGKAEGGMLHVTGSYDLDMTDYGLKPPTLMFGRIKVNKTVKVNYDLMLKS